MRIDPSTSECLLFLGKQTQEIDTECTSGGVTQIIGGKQYNLICVKPKREIVRDVRT